MKEAREKLVYYNMSKAERQAYDEHLSAIMIQNDVLDGAKLEGRMEGRAEGRAEGIKIMARNLKAAGLSVEAISKASGLTLEEIDRL